MPTGRHFLQTPRPSSPPDRMLRAKDMPVLFGATPGGVSRPAPLLGQNGREILAEYRCDAYVIAALIAGGGVTEERAA